MITTMICGPLHEHSLKNIEVYQQYGDVLISCYDTDDISIIPSIPNVTVVQTTLPPHANANSGKVFYQAWSTYQGLQFVNTEFVIRTRSDEQWGNLQPFIDKMLASPDKLTSCNIFFKGTPEPLHPSDHLYGGKSQYFRDGLSRFLQYYPSMGYAHGLLFDLPHLGAFATGETPMFLCFLYGLGIAHTITIENMNHVTFDNTVLVNIDELQPYIYAYGWHDGKHYETTSDFIYTIYPSLRSMDEFWTIKYQV